MKRWPFILVLGWLVLTLRVFCPSFSQVTIKQAEALATASVASSPTITNVPRSGVDINNSAYFSSQVTANYFSNPGFEFPQFAQAITVNTVPTSDTFTAVQTASDASNFWVGTNNCWVRVGTCSDGSNNYCWNTASGASVVDGGCTGGASDCDAGTVFSISAYSQSSGTQTFTCTGGTCPKLSVPNGSSDNADIVGCRQVVTNPLTYFTHLSTWDNPWTASNESDAFVTSAEAYQGNSSLEITGTNQGVTYLWDNSNIGNPSVCLANPQDLCTQNSDCPASDTCQLSGNGPFVNHPIKTGTTWTFSFYAETASAGETCTATLERASDGDMLNQTFNITNGGLGAGGWNQYSTTFSGNDTSTTLGTLNFDFTCTSGTVYIDNIFLGRPSDDTGNWRNEVITDLQALNVGSVRHVPDALTGGNLTEAQETTTNDYLIPVTGDVEANGVGYGQEYSYGDLAVVANATSSTTSIYTTIPIAWSDADYTAYGTQLCSWETTYSFPRIVVECNNENWNSAASDYWKVNFPYYPAYGMACARAFNLISAACSDSQIKYLIDDQQSNSSVVFDEQASVAYSGSTGFPNTSQYGMSTALYGGASYASTDSYSTLISDFFASSSAISSCPTNGLPCIGQFYTSTVADNESSSLCYGNGNTGSCNQIIGGYEGDISSSGCNGCSGLASNLQASNINVGWGATGPEMQTHILALSLPNAAQSIGTNNDFTLNESGNNGVLQWGLTPYNWGLNSDFAPTFPWFRPQGLVIELFNSAIISGAGYYPVTGLPSGVYCDAFGASSTWTIACSNANSSPQAVSVTFPSGTVPTVAKTILFTNGQTDNNEAVNNVTLGNLSGGVSYSGQTGSFTMPAYGAVALLQSGVIPQGNAIAAPPSMLMSAR